MKLLKQEHEIISTMNYQGALSLVERAGRTCYKSTDRMSPTVEEAEAFIRMLITKGHESVLEHYNISVYFLTNRAITHELVRHRICAYSQESTRYVRYNNIEVIEPMFEDHESLLSWSSSIKSSEFEYQMLLGAGNSPQAARGVLPNDLATRIICTTNLRQWRHMLRLRASRAAHPQIRQLMIGLLTELQEKMPVFFEDIEVEV